ncbi:MULTISPECIES: hypothetical protein [unclassified Coleofasciculus]|uniref:hypothetical protein n=1 Tax=unclassified Coleofasciculus TaxID=2692782 RepID=UPI00187FD930|nr:MULTISPECIES: hypothetical protein [unclassified Coleofasciculus]MBE9129706.1 hypothetical protein [Coleofasciculus sp. LEGE 07081]MBE9152215.1 hypothetical protein [Coleofasciculus sp. LEGE 07092]
MKIEKYTAIVFSVVLLSVNLAIAQPTSSPPTANQPTPTLSDQQQEEVQQLIENEIDRSRTISDRVQSEVDRTFGWTIDLINLLITVLIAIPIVTGLAAFFLRQSIIDQLVRQTKKQLKFN